MSLLLCGGLPKAAHKNAVSIHINLGLWPEEVNCDTQPSNPSIPLASDQSEAQVGQASSIRDHFTTFNSSVIDFDFWSSAPQLVF